MRADVVGVVDVCAVRGWARCEGERSGVGERAGGCWERERRHVLGCWECERWCAGERWRERVDERDCGWRRLWACGAYGECARGGERVRGERVGV